MKRETTSNGTVVSIGPPIKTAEYAQWFTPDFSALQPLTEEQISEVKSEFIEPLVIWRAGRPQKPRFVFAPLTPAESPPPEVTKPTKWRDTSWITRKPNPVRRVPQSRTVTKEQIRARQAAARSTRAFCKHPMRVSGLCRNCPRF